jgi:uncharacterized membrane protein
MESFRDIFIGLTELAMLLINFMALIVVVYATIEAFVKAATLMLARDEDKYARVWLRYAHWLVAALTFQLASDIIETALAPTWEDIAQLGAIALIRTFLNYFLNRDVSEADERREKTASDSVVGERA